MALAATTGAIEVDLQGFKQDMWTLTRIYGKEVGEVITQFHKNWTIGLMKRFPPSKQMFSGRNDWKAVSAATGVKGEKKLGERRVEKDIRHVLVPMSASEINHVREFREGHMLGGNNIFTRSDGAVWLVEKRMYEPDAGSPTMKAWHDRQRMRDGRVTRAGTYTRDIGRWKAVDKMHVKKSALNRYIRERKRRVGALKGGWANAVLHFGGKVPVWISKNASGRGGGSIDKDGNGVLFSVNPVPYAGQYQRVLDWTVTNARKAQMNAVKKAQRDAIRKEKQASKGK